MIGTFIKYIVCDLCIDAAFKRMATAIMPMLSIDQKHAVIKTGTHFLGITLKEIEATRSPNPHDIYIISEAFYNGKITSTTESSGWFSVSYAKHCVSYLTNTTDNQDLVISLQSSYPNRKVKRLGRLIVVEDYHADDMVYYTSVDEIILAATDTKPITRHSFI